MTVFYFTTKRWILGLLLGLLGVTGGLRAQEEPETPKKSLIDLEIDFFNFLMDEKLYSYAPMVLEELSESHPTATDRIEVARASLRLRLGKVKEVEEWLATKNVATDAKAQAVLLQLGNVYDAIGEADKARTAYGKFLKVNEGKTISDPDVLRYFIYAASRLGALQIEAGEYDAAIKTFKMVAQSSKEKIIQRRFAYFESDALLQKLLNSPAPVQKTTFAQMKVISDDLMWVPDNFYYASVGLNAQALHRMGKDTEALEVLAKVRPPSVKIEKTMKERGIPLTEFPRPVQRYAEGVINFSQAKAKAAEGDEDEAKVLAGKAASHLYNSFLKYGDHPYAKRSGIKLEEVKLWVKDSLGVEGTENASANSAEIIFSRKLDLAKEQLRLRQYPEAESTLVEALNEYPVTKYSVEALESLSRALHPQEKYWEEVALANYLSERWPEDPEAGKVVLRIGKALWGSVQFTFPTENVLATFGRTYRDHPDAANFLYQMGHQADQAGRKADAQAYFKEVVTLFPGSARAVKAQERRANEALSLENFVGAAEIYQEILDTAPRGPDRARVQHKLAEVVLRFDEPAVDRSILLLSELIAAVDPSKKDPVYYGDERGIAVSTHTYDESRYSLSRAYLIAARVKADPEMQAMAEKEIKGYLEDFKGKGRVPESMFNLGRLLLQQGKTSEAQIVFDDLAKNFSETEYGKDALYALVKAALEEGQISVAEDAVQDMLEKADKYELEKIQRVARLMLDEKQFDAAHKAYKVIVDHPRMVADPKKAQLEIYRLAQASIGIGRMDDAVTALEKIIEKYPNTTLVVDAGISLSEIYTQQEEYDKGDAALQSVARVVTSLKKDKMLANMRYKLAVARLFQGKGENSKALNEFLNLSQQKPENPEQAMVVKAAILAGLAETEALDAAGNINAPSYIVELTDLYIQSFPLDEMSVLDDMQARRRKAFLRIPE